MLNQTHRRLMILFLRRVITFSAFLGSIMLVQSCGLTWLRQPTHILFARQDSRLELVHTPRELLFVTSGFLPVIWNRFPR